MNRPSSAVRMVFYLPALWIALGVVAVVVVANSEPLVDIVAYAIYRLMQ